MGRQERGFCHNQFRLQAIGLQIKLTLDQETLFRAPTQREEGSGHSRADSNKAGRAVLPEW